MRRYRIVSVYEYRVSRKELHIMESPRFLEVMQVLKIRKDILDAMKMKDE